MNPRPVDVRPLEDYKLFVTFQNGETRIFDAKPMLSMPIYQPLRNKGFFALAKADGMCVYWNDDVDLCPDTLYTSSRPAKNPTLAWDPDFTKLTAKERRDLEEARAGEETVSHDEINWD